MVFVRSDPSRMMSTKTLEDTPYTELCMTDASGATRLLLAGRASDKAEAMLVGMCELVLSHDEKTVYFVTSAWTTSSAAHAVSLRTGRERFIIDGGVESEITSGADRGNLWVTQTRLDERYGFDSPKYRGRIVTRAVVTQGGRVIRRIDPSP